MYLELCLGHMTLEISVTLSGGPGTTSSRDHEHVNVGADEM